MKLKHIKIAIRETSDPDRIEVQVVLPEDVKYDRHAMTRVRRMINAAKQQIGD